jgi:hypothetical protein
MDGVAVVLEVPPNTSLTEKGACVVRRRIVLWALSVAIALLSALGACIAAAPAAAQPITIQGRAAGDDPTGLQPNNELPTKPLVAKISCNGIVTTTESNGHYRHLVKPHSAYRCQAEAPGYVARAATLSRTTAISLMLDSSARGQAGCDAHAPSHVECPVLHLVMGTVTGTMTYTSNHQALTLPTAKAGGFSARPSYMPGVRRNYCARGADT